MATEPIEDIVRRYARNEDQFRNILYQDLTYFHDLCSACYTGRCYLPSKKNGCFEQYLIELGYVRIERRKVDVPVVEEKRKKGKK
mgnify:CR=1 FL=1